MNKTKTRKGISLLQVAEKFRTEEKAEDWFVRLRWGGRASIACPKCGYASVGERGDRKPTPFQCNRRKCRYGFSVRTGTVMQSSKIALRKWAIAYYLMSTNLKGISSHKLAREIGITQKSAWHMLHRIRESWDDNHMRFFGPVEADETYIGGKEGNKHESKKLKAGRGAVGKAAVVGVKDRRTGRVAAQHVERTDRATMSGFVRRQTAEDAKVYTDEASWFGDFGPRREHEQVNHLVKEFVRGNAHTNGIESFWSMLKRGHYGIYHHFSAKHLPRYVSEFSGRHNFRPLDTLDQMAWGARAGIGKRLRYTDLIGPKSTRQPRLIKPT